MNLTLKNDLNEIIRLSEAVDNYVCENGLEARLAFDINLALEEIVTNIISYGYKDIKGDDAVIDIFFNLQSDTLEITVKDQAVPFNPLELPEPETDLSVEDRPIGGLGIHLVRKLMDSLSYRREDDSNLLIMSKQVSNN